MKKVLITAGLLLTAGFLTAHFVRQAKLLKQTCFNFGGYKINTLNKDKINLEIYLNILNRSDISVTLKSYSFNVYLNNTKVSTLVSNTPQYVDRNGFAPLKLEIDIIPKDILNFNLLSNLLLDFNNAMVKIQGTVSINAAGIPKSIPVLINRKLRDMVPSGNSQVCAI